MSDGDVICVVWVKAHETAWAVSRADYEPLMAAWTGGKTFHTCTTAVSQQPVTFRLGEVIAVALQVLDKPDDAPPWASND